MKHTVLAGNELPDPIVLSSPLGNTVPLFAVLLSPQLFGIDLSTSPLTLPPHIALGAHHHRHQHRRCLLIEISVTIA